MMKKKFLIAPYKINCICLFLIFREAEVAISICLKFIAQGQISPSSIGLFTCYKGQKCLLDQISDLATQVSILLMIKRYPSLFSGYDQKELNKPQVQLIDTEIPYDKEIAIVSLVRSNQKVN